MESNFIYFDISGESETVVKDLAAAGIECELIDCSHQFYNASCPIQGNGKTQFLQEPSQILCKTIEPEQKRKIIGDTFIRVGTDFDSIRNLQN